MAMYTAKRLPANEDRIYKARQYEEKLQDRLAHVNEYRHLMLNAEFEIAAGPKVKYRTFQEKVESQKQQQDRRLAERREKLRRCFFEEDSRLQFELETATMNLAERRAWLETRARNLRLQREAMRGQYSEEMMQKQFRESCDDVRAHDSRLAVARATAGRQVQIDEKKRMELELKLQNAELDKLLEQEWAHQEERYLRELEEQHQKKTEAAQILRNQIDHIQHLREEEKETILLEMRELNQKWAEEAEVLRQKQYQQRCYDAQRAQELLEYNEKRVQEKHAEALEEKQFDAHLCALVQEREKVEEAQDLELKAAQRREAQSYAMELQTALNKQKELEEKRNAIIEAEAEEEWERRDAIKRHEDLERRKLFEACHEDRQDNIRRKEERLELEKEEKVKARNQYTADAQAQAQEEHREKQREKMTKQELLHVLEAQMNKKQATTLIEKEKKRLEHAHANLVESKHKAKIEKVVNLPFPEPNHSRRTTKWYD